MSKHASDRPLTTRRQFGRTVAALAALPLASHAPAADEPKRTAADALTEFVRLRYGKHLTDDQMKHVERSLQGNVRLGEFLSRVKLQNGDEPAFTFTADV